MAEWSKAPDSRFSPFLVSSLVESGVEPNGGVGSSPTPDNHVVEFCQNTCKGVVYFYFFEKKKKKRNDTLRYLIVDTGHLR